MKEQISNSRYFWFDILNSSDEVLELQGRDLTVLNLPINANEFDSEEPKTLKYLLGGFVPMKDKKYKQEQDGVYRVFPLVESDAEEGIVVRSFGNKRFGEPSNKSSKLFFWYIRENGAWVIIHMPATEQVIKDGILDIRGAVPYITPVGESVMFYPDVDDEDQEELV